MQDKKQFGAFVRSKRGDKVLSIYWFLILFIVTGAVIYMASSFYGTPYDVRMLESHELGNQIANCLTSNGYFNDNALDSNFDENILSRCNLNFNVEDNYGWTNKSEYYFEVGIYGYNKGSFNLLGPQLADIRAGNPNLKTTWQLSTTSGESAVSGFFSNVLSAVSNFFTGKRKINTIVIHTTDGSSASGAIETIAKKDINVHYMIDRNGYIYSSAQPPAQFANAFVPEDQAASHAGCGIGSSALTSCSSLPASSGCIDKNPINSNGILDAKCQNLSNPPQSEWCCIPGFNSNSIGIELVNLGPLCTGINGGFCENSVLLDGYKWENFSNSPDQMNSLSTLVADIALRYKIPVDRDHIIGHYQITTYKTDPGPDFPWDSFLKEVKAKELILSAPSQSGTGDKNLPQGEMRSFYTVDRNGNQYVVQVLAIIGKVEKNV